MCLNADPSLDDQQPSAEQRRSGEKRISDLMNTFYRCSECRQVFTEATRFCPNCGVRHVAAEEEE